ncbi:uncharacterized protein LOC113271810 [Papaver somniferum]|uniref:uncharacterized protein LOC113271810 n=1 Tax=Papaver somniferum TaxID=3469 RepID=UPI000E7051E2|nr:uncharacterized protein LOC113271810 [Papaver somniferum]
MGRVCAPLLLTRYSATTILALLKEVAQYPDLKIDWNALIKKTNTGITNAAEYQKLWRHLAYCARLPETVEEKPEAPLQDDDSDLEYELEAFPPVNDEASLEAAACVKVLLASGLSDYAGRQEEKCSLKGMDITVPVSVQKQSPPGVTTTAKGLYGTVVTEAKELDGNAANPVCSQPAKRKRKPWTTEEDNELISAVKKLGERNWANILKADIFKGDRTASQLSQRWGIIRKRINVKSLPGGGASGIQYELTEQQLASNRAVSHALNMSVNNSLWEAYGIDLTEGTTVSGQQIRLQTPKGTSSVTEKPLVITKKADSIVPNSIIQAAAGARIATPSTAKSLIKAAQSKTGVHISTIGESSMPVPSVSPPPPAMERKISSVSSGTLSCASTSCGTIAAGKRTFGVRSVEVGNTLKEEKVQGSPKEDEVKNSPRELVNIAEDGKQDHQTVLPDSVNVIEDQTTQNLSKLLNVEDAASDPMRLDNHHMVNEKESAKNSPGTAISVDAVSGPSSSQ